MRTSAEPPSHSNAPEAWPAAVGRAGSRRRPGVVSDAPQATTRLYYCRCSDCTREIVSFSGRSPGRPRLKIRGTTGECRSVWCWFSRRRRSGGHTAPAVRRCTGSVLPGRWTRVYALAVEAGRAEKSERGWSAGRRPGRSGVCRLTITFSGPDRASMVAGRPCRVRTRRIVCGSCTWPPGKHVTKLGGRAPVRRALPTRDCERRVVSASNRRSRPICSLGTSCYSCRTCGCGVCGGRWCSFSSGYGLHTHVEHPLPWRLPRTRATKGDAARRMTRSSWAQLADARPAGRAGT
jgi:hypothetical protein